MTKADILLQMHDFCDTLNENQRRLVADAVTLRTYKRGQAIYSAGDKPLNLLCLLDGKVKIVKQGVGDRQQIVRVLRPVSYFGYRASFAGERFATAAVAFEACVVGFIPLNLLHTLMAQSHRLAMFFMRQLSIYLGQADARTVSLTQKHIRGRLAETLLFLRDSYGLEDDGCTLSIALSREDIACLSNMTTSNAIRTLSAFAHEGVIATVRRKIRLLDPAILQKISRFG